MSGAASDGRLRERFVGRGKELRALGSHFSAVEAGRGQIVLLGGEAGIGKTRLVEQFLGSVAKRRVLWGRSRAAEGTPAYWPWRQVLKAYAETVPDDRLREDLGDGGRDVARLVPTLRGRLGIAADESSAVDDQARFQLFEAVAELLARAAADELLAIVLEDLHWADRESLLLLRHLGAGVTQSRLLIVGTFREVEMRQAPHGSRILGDLARVSQRISLRGLTDDEVAAFARNVLADLSDTAVAELSLATGGNPFFVKQVMALLHRDGWNASSPLPIPIEVREAVRLRLAPLTPAVRWLLALAAVLGREFDLDVLARLVELSDAEALSLLSEPIALGLVAEADQALRLRFTNGLVQDTLYDDLPAADRASLHRAAGDVLEALHGREPEASFAEIARHYFRSVGPSLEKAVHFSVRAAEHARTTLGYEEAAGHYERALAAQRTLGRPADERLGVLLEFGEAQALAGDVEGLRATFLEAARMAREQRDATALARAALGYGRMPSLQADDPILVGLLEEALRGLPSGDSVLRARLHARLVLATYYGGSLAERERHAREAVAIARRLGDSTTEAIALRSHYYNLVGTPDLPARLEILHDSVRAAERAGDRAVACEARVNMVGEYLELGDLARADRALAIAAETADRLRLPRLRWRATVLQAARALLSGDLAGAEACSDRALGMAGYGADSGDAMAVHTAVLFAVRRAQGRLAEIAPTVAAIAERGGSPNWQSLLALLHAETGARADAAGILARMAARHFADLRIDWSWLPTLAHFADVCAIVEDRSAAADLERLLRRDASPVVTAPFTCLGASSRYLGVLALVQGRADDAVRLLDEALALNLRLGAQVEVVRTQIALVRALAERGVAGDRERASTLHAEAETTAKLAGLAGFAPVLEQLLVQPARRTPARVLEASLRREGADWIVACAEESTRLRGTKGVGYLLRLLREPGRSFAALELAGSDVHPAVPGGAAAAEAVAVAPRERLRQRARELREELTEAEEFNDLGRAASLREEMEEIAEELSAGIRPDGRPTNAASDAKTAERARLNVTRALQAVVRRIGEGCPVLGGHLQSAIRTGSLCAYVPDPDPGIAWRL